MKNILKKQKSGEFLRFFALVRARRLFYSMIAAATKNDYYSKDDDPGAVIVKDVTQAVVIHMFASGS